MARKRKLNADLPPEADTDDVENAPKSALGGMWGGSAMNMLKQRIEDAHGSLSAGILAGTVALALDPGQVNDAVGTDRRGNWQEDDEFRALVANIKRRGQTQPIRVRPADPDWQPSATAPLETDAEFIIQSGRRRLEACRQLGIKVQAIVATDAGDQALADLEERFHENTMRKNLSGFEELLSIGLLAQAMSDLTQTEIAARLSVPQGDVSLGLACLENRIIIEKQIDTADIPKRQFRTLIPKIKRGERLAPKEPLLPPALTGDVPQRFDVRGIRMNTKPNKKGGVSLTIPQAHVDQDNLEAMLVEIAKVIAKHQGKSK